MKYLLMIMMLVAFATNSFADLQIESERKSWLDLAPSTDVFEEGVVNIIIGMSDYISFNVNNLKSEKPDLIKNLKEQACVYWGEVSLRPSCFSYLKANYEDAYLNLIFDFLEHYDLETPSYSVILKNAQYVDLDQNFVLKRLNTSIDLSSEQLDPMSLLNTNVFNALWTVPTNEANCFGTAYAAVTPNSPLMYRDYLWGGKDIDFSTKKPKGYLHFEITDDLQFGDIIEFEITGDGHAIVYLGTDQEGDHIVLTKNGFMPSVVQVMKYDDVYNLYSTFGINKVNVWRQDPNSIAGYATTDLNSLANDLQSMINTRKNSVEVSIDESLAIRSAKKFSNWMNKKVSK